MNYPIHLNKIETIKKDLWYSNDKKFANDCGVSYPTYLAIRSENTSGMKFLNGLNKLLVRNNLEPQKITSFIKD